jgi:general secretion pathway protein K
VTRLRRAQGRDYGGQARPREGGPVRRSSAVRRNEGGAVLITVLLAVLLLTVAVLSARQGVDGFEAAVQGEAARQQASALSRSGLALVQKAFATDDAASDSYQDPWALANDQGPIPVGELGVVTVQVEDEEGKFDVNWLVNQAGEADTQWGGRFVRLFTRLGLEQVRAEEMVASLVDWIDADGSPGEGGAEEEYYAALPRPYTPRNARFQTIGEVALVKGFSRDLLERGERQAVEGRAPAEGGEEASIPPLSRFLTVFGNRERKVNANTAPAEIVFALSEAVDEALAEDLVGYRKDTPFARVDDVRSVPGMTDVYPALSARLTVATSHISVAVAGENPLVVSRCRGVFSRMGKAVRLVYYRGF